MKIAQNVAGILKDHVTLEVEGIDRMYLNVYVPQLQCEQASFGSSVSIATSPGLRQP